ncbi:MAG: hypothetical protein ACLU93_02725 [Streptococcus sp.]
MAGKNKKTESDFIKELEALEQQKREATEQLKAYLKSQTDKLGQIYFELKKLENPDLSIDELVVETQNKVKEVKKEIKQRKKLSKERILRDNETYNDSRSRTKQRKFPLLFMLSPLLINIHLSYITF